uniref:Mitochondrial import inner membrane translocase subunit n=1 Tax=Amphimedon queenslandica TaxID=400682 RepID=A0A1X7VP96_AMPQE
MDESMMLRNMKQYALVYNQLSEECFKGCVSRLSQRNLSDQELECVDSCAEKLLKANYRLNLKAAEMGPTNKMM